MNYQIRRGDIFYIRNERYREGSEIKKDRPAVIVSNDMNNRYGNVVEVVFLTSKPKKKDMPTHVVIKSTGRRSIALCEQPTAVAVERLQNWIGSATAKEMKQIDDALLVVLGIETERRRGK